MEDVFVERAMQLSDTRRLLDGDEQYPSALALVAVHAAISWNDALLAKLGGRFQGVDHMEAVRVTARRCTAQKLDKTGIKHLEKLIQNKTRVSYSQERTTVETAQGLSLAAERFEAWANRLLKELA